jgi:hypothetical protein
METIRMDTRTESYVESVDHLPAGAMLVIQGVSWDEYEHLLQDLGDAPGVRVSYDEGRLTNESRGKFSIYASFGIPEIWRYDGKRVEMYGLTGTTYAELPTSRSFPGLTCSMLLEFLELSKTKGQTESLKAFRQRMRSAKS